MSDVRKGINLFRLNLLLLTLLTDLLCSLGFERLSNDSYNCGRSVKEERDVLTSPKIE